MTIAGATVAAPALATRGGLAQPAGPLIGYLGSESPELFASRLRAFQRGLSTIGFDEGRNLAVEYRWARGRNNDLPALAADLVRRRVSAIATPGSIVAALAAKAATSVIPIIFETGSDPVERGLVASLNRPGGNLTGVTSLNQEVAPKRLELLRQLIPTASIVGLLVNPTNRAVAETLSKSLQEPARVLGFQLNIVNASRADDFQAAFETLLQRRAAGLVIASDPLFSTRSEPLAELAARHAMPAIHQSRDFAAAGGLASYGGNFRQSHYHAGVYTGRILNGEKPADLPVQQVTEIELVINLKTAKTLNLTVPLTLLGRADEVIE